MIGDAATNNAAADDNNARLLRKGSTHRVLVVYRGEEVDG